MIVRSSSKIFFSNFSHHPWIRRRFCQSHQFHQQVLHTQRLLYPSSNQCRLPCNTSKLHHHQSRHKCHTRLNPSSSRRKWSRRK